eukprot:5093950-Prymnesium_polylepis.1
MMRYHGAAQARGIKPCPLVDVPTARARRAGAAAPVTALMPVVLSALPWPRFGRGSNEQDVLCPAAATRRADA